MKGARGRGGGVWGIGRGEAARQEVFRGVPEEFLSRGVLEFFGSVPGRSGPVPGFTNT